MTWLIGLLCAAATTLSAQDLNPQLRLADDLDYPGEGYCIDVIGVGASARQDLPLVMHNCIPNKRTLDRYAFVDIDRIYMPGYDACVTALGVTTVLPGVPLMLRPCGVDESFLFADRFQRFERTQNDQLRLVGSDLCLAAGHSSRHTYNRAHRWRTLTLETCSTVPPALSVWN